MERTNFLARLLALTLVCVFAAMLCICSAHAGPPVSPAAKAPMTNPEANTPPSKAPPQMSVGVVQCGEIVAIWVLTQDGKMYRTDAEHHPDDPKVMNDFLTWLKTAEQDVYVLPCPNK